MTEDIIRKVKALLAMAESTTNEAEAISFATKAQELLSKHNIDAALLAPDEKAELTSERQDFKYLGPLWRRLHDATARLYFCRMYWKSELDDTKRRIVTRMHFVGRPHNVAIAGSMADYLTKTVTRLAKQHSKIRKEQIAFERGCLVSLSRRVLEMIPDVAPGESITSGGLPALYANEGKLVQDHLDSFVKRTVASNAKVAKNSSTMAGAAAGRNIPLNVQVGDVAGANGVKLLG